MAVRGRGSQWRYQGGRDTSEGEEGHTMALTQAKARRARWCCACELLRQVSKLPNPNPAEGGLTMILSSISLMSRAWRASSSAVGTCTWYCE